MYNVCDHSSTFIFYLIFFTPVGNQDIHIIASMSLNFGHITPLTKDLAAPERLKNIVFPGFLFHFYPDLFTTNWYNILSV